MVNTTKKDQLQPILREHEKYVDQQQQKSFQKKNFITLEESPLEILQRVLKENLIRLPEGHSTNRCKRLKQVLHELVGNK